MWLYFASLHHLDTSIVVAIVYVYPALVAVLVAVRSRRFPRVPEILLLCLALCGVVIIAVFDGGAYTSRLGVILAASTAIGYAIYVVVVASVINFLPPLAASCWVLLGAAGSSLCVALLMHRLEMPTTQSGWFYIFLHGFIVVPIGLAALSAGLSRLGATRASIVDTSQPAIATLVGVVVLGEHLRDLQVLGIFVVMLAVVGLPLTAGWQARRKRPVR